MPAFGRSFLTNRVVAPGETISVFSTRDLGLVQFKNVSQKLRVFEILDGPRTDHETDGLTN